MDSSFMLTLNSFCIYHINMFNYTLTLKKEKINHQDEWSTVGLWGEGGGSDHHHRSFQGEDFVIPVMPEHHFLVNYVAQVLAVEVAVAALLVPPGPSPFPSTVITPLIIVPVFCSEEHSVIRT